MTNVKKSILKYGAENWRTETCETVASMSEFMTDKQFVDWFCDDPSFDDATDEDLKNELINILGEEDGLAVYNIYRDGNSNLTVDKLNCDQLRELKQRYLADKQGDELSMNEMINIDRLVSDDEIKKEYSGTIFSPDDFFCSEGQ